MMLTISPASRFTGEVVVPSSKSHTVRALLLALLARGRSRVKRMLESDDTRTCMNVVRALGGNVDGERISGNGVRLITEANEIFTGDSGITTTFVVPILGLRRDAASVMRVSMGVQMAKRPIEPLCDALAPLGMRVAKRGKILEVSGALRGGKSCVRGSNSQYLSALLMALPFAVGDSVIDAVDTQEWPYIEMTLSWLRNVGISIRHEVASKRRHRFFIRGRQHMRAFSRAIPADFSSASYPIAAAVLIPGRVMVRGVDMRDAQGDKRLVNVLRRMGADISATKCGLVVRGGCALHGIAVDMGDMPDMVPTLAVVATQADGVTHIKNIRHAREKETDRISAMATQLRTMGARVTEKPSSLSVYRSKLHGARLHGYRDHRTIMALAVAGLVADGVTRIDTAEGISKTFPTFPALMASLGAEMKFTS